MKKIAVVGSRSFQDLNLLTKTLDELPPFELICGMQEGADLLGYDYAKEKGYPIQEFPADWYPDGKTLDRGAGFKRNAEMRKVAELVVAFWDGLSPGTREMIEESEKAGLKVQVVYFSSQTLFRTEYPYESPVMLLTDRPGKEEKFTPWSNASNQAMISMLRNGKTNPREQSDFLGITSDHLFCSYLDYNNATQYHHEISSKKHPGWHKLENHKNIYVSPRLWDEIQKTVEEIKKVKPSLIIVVGKWSLFFLCGLGTLDSNLKSIEGGLNTYRGSHETLSDCWGYADAHIVYPMWHYTHIKAVVKDAAILKYDVKRVSDIFKEVSPKGVRDRYAALRYRKDFDSTFKIEIGDTFQKATKILDKLLLQADKAKEPLRWVCDLETQYYFEKGKNKELSDSEKLAMKPVIDTVGFATAPDEGYAIPFCTKEIACLWSYREFEILWFKLYRIFNHPKIQFFNQNFQYDTQYLKALWHLDVKIYDDTMIFQGIIHNRDDKDLGYLSSVYNPYHRYWKDALKEQGFVRWDYCAKDCCATYMVFLGQQFHLENQKENEKALVRKKYKQFREGYAPREAELKQIDQEYQQLEELYRRDVDELLPQMLRTMERGVRVDTLKMQDFKRIYTHAGQQLTEELNGLFDFLPEPPNFGSVDQKKKIFKDLLGFQLEVKKKKNSKGQKVASESVDAASMKVYAQKYPQADYLIKLLLEQAALQKVLSSTLSMRIPEDNRFYTSYGFANTGRFTSKVSTFGFGGNAQNLSSKGEKVQLALARDLLEEDDLFAEMLEEIGYDLLGVGKFTLPNLKRLFIPDPGMALFDADLGGADNAHFAAICECKHLLDFFENPAGRKVATYLISDYLQKDVDPKSAEYKQYKAAIHLTNYVGQAKKLAETLGWEEKTAVDLQKWYFSVCPEIPKAHDRIRDEVLTKGYTSNWAGRRYEFKDTSKETNPTWLNQAVASKAQGGVADSMNRAFAEIGMDKRGFFRAASLIVPQILLQVHDSFVGQTDKKPEIFIPTVKAVLDYMSVPVTYQNGITIKVLADVKVSSVSYGDCIDLDKWEKQAVK